MASRPDAGRIRRSLAGLAAASLAVAAAASAGARAETVDSFADRVVAFTSGFADPNAGFRYSELPGIVLGPPGASLPTQGSISTLSLGHGGRITLAFTDNEIVDGPGPDFIVFENAFFKGSVPSSPTTTCYVFAEPGKVEVSGNGSTWVAYPFDAGALALVGADQTACASLPALRGLAGLTPTFTGNWTVPDDPDVWDPDGIGGVSGAGGDAFDLATVGLSRARFVRITDLNLATGFAGTAEGFDLDAVVALHAVPAPAYGPDDDGDGLPDADETNVYFSDPFRADTDGDGVADGAEVAASRSPLGASLDPAFVYEADLVFPETSAASLRWNFLSATATYDLIRASLGSVARGADPVNLGAVTCVEENSFNLTSADHADTADPAPGGAFLYLLRPAGGDYGLASDGRPRAAASGDCVP